MVESKKTILIILGAQTGEYAKGEFNRGLFETAQEQLGKKYDIITTIIKDGYTVNDEIEKWKKADFIIYQYPIYWFMMPPILKKYIDDVYAFGAFYEFNDGPYGSGGLMKGKQVMLSTTWGIAEDTFGGDFFDGADRDTVLLPMRKSQAYCGISEMPHFSCHNIDRKANYDEDKKRYIKHLQSIFEL
jgi:modulator of drug activity B